MSCNNAEYKKMEQDWAYSNPMTLGHFANMTFGRADVYNQRINTF
jgi:hypothetical protein